MENKITIEKEPYAETLWFAGVYENQEGEFEFNICDSGDGNGDSSILQINWSDGEPGGDDTETKVIEEEIVKQYQNR